VADWRPAAHTDRAGVARLPTQRVGLICSLVVVVVDDVLGLVPTVESLTDDDAVVVVEDRSSPSAIWSELLQAGPPTAFLRGGSGGCGRRADGAGAEARRPEFRIAR
jgi:hypothetical protein